MSTLQAVLWGAQAGIIKSFFLGFHRSTVEFDNREAYDIIDMHEHIFIPEELSEVMTQINTFHENHFSEGMTERFVSVIPLQMNRSAEYMAIYGLNNLPAFAEAPDSFGNLQYYLDRDMGMALPFQLMNIDQNFGLGEVVDAPPHNPSSLDYPDNSMHLDVAEALQLLSQAVFPPVLEDGSIMPARSSVVVPYSSSSIAASNFPPSPLSRDGSSTHSIKGKGKVLAHYSFNNDGLLSQEAIKILDEGCLSSVSKIFLKKVIDLDAEIFKGIYAKDVLEAAVKGQLYDLMASIKPFSITLKLSGSDPSDIPEPSSKKIEVIDKFYQPAFASDMELMDVEQLLLEMARFEEEMMSKS